MSNLDTSDPIVAQALDLCVRAHEGQYRWGGEPYHTHPIEVACLVQEHTDYSPVWVASALLHDVYEDCDRDFYKEIETIQNGKNIMCHVLALSNQVIDKAYNRRVRAAANALHYMYQKPQIQTIKLLDRYHNLSTTDRDSKFYKVYATESKLLHDVCIYAEPHVRDMLWKMIVSKG